MEKLKLEHLAPYLPYAVMVNLFERNYTINGLSKETIFTNEGAVLNYGSSENHIKPILRPLSDLDKELFMNGNYGVIPIKRLRSDFNSDLCIHQPLNYSHEIEFNIETENYSQHVDLFDGYKIVQQLVEWHFDVFNLIEKGLAIDINTLDK